MPLCATSTPLLPPAPPEPEYGEDPASPPLPPSPKSSCAEPSAPLISVAVVPPVVKPSPPVPYCPSRWRDAGTFTATILSEELPPPDENGYLYLKNIGSESVFFGGDGGGSFPTAPELGELKPLDFAFFRVADGRAVWLTAASGQQPVQFLWLNN